MNIDTRVEKVLHNLGMADISELRTLTEHELLTIRQVGRKTHREILKRLKERGLTLRQEAREE